MGDREIDQERHNTTHSPPWIQIDRAEETHHHFFATWRQKNRAVKRHLHISPGRYTETEKKRLASSEGSVTKRD
jgi:hypothetical protein